MSFSAGFARTDMTVFEPGMAMQGWAQPGNRVGSVETALHARAAVFVDAAGARFAYVCIELNFVSWALRQGVLAALARDHGGRGFTPHSVMLTATHTHSGPSGFSQYPLYNASGGGFSPLVWSGAVDSIVAAIVAADDAREPAVLRLGHADIPMHEDVAFNRSLPAWRTNRDVAGPATLAGAVDRRSISLRVDDRAGRALGVINWFGVHATNVHADQTGLHADNKGLAAAAFETFAASRSGFREGFVAIFAQAAAGDVQPNFRFDARRRLLVGGGHDDAHSAALNADIQFRYARQGFEAALHAPPLVPEIQARSIRADLGATAVDADLAGRRACVTQTAHIGLGHATGSHEGPGPLLALEPWLRGYARLRRGMEKDADPRASSLDVGRGTGGHLGALPTRWAMPVVARFAPMIAFLEAAFQAGELSAEGWVPDVLPLQVVALGGLVIAGVPSEPTVNAARRLRQTLAAALKVRGPQAIVINGYANAYAGYLCTYEEYMTQAYEGSATYYGPWSLAAYQTHFRALALRLGEDEAREGGPAPDVFDPARLIRQRLGGRRGMRQGGGAERFVPQPPHLTHLRAFSPAITSSSFFAEAP